MNQHYKNIAMKLLLIFILLFVIGLPINNQLEIIILLFFIAMACAVGLDLLTVHTVPFLITMSASPAMRMENRNKKNRFIVPPVTNLKERKYAYEIKKGPGKPRAFFYLAIWIND